MSSMTRRTFLRRSALAGAVSLSPVVLTGCSNSSSPASTGGSGGNSSAAGSGSSNLDLTANIGGNYVSRQQVLVWEARRLQVVASRMSGNMAASLIEDLSALIVRQPEDTSDIVQERNLLADAKIKAGDAAMRQLIANDLLISGPLMSASAALPGYSTSQIDIISNQGTAEGFASWFADNFFNPGNERSILVACPDHYVFNTVTPNVVNASEEMGGALLVASFVLELGSDTARLPIVTEPDFPIRFTGAGLDSAHDVAGGFNHRFKNLDQGFQSRLGVFFPSTLPFWIPAEHQWHLACEFSNWITAYIEETGG
ncbi:MAG: hypothetical protein OSA97_05095 [Nevskia sp.]|nr:hypothetical protein [Nevskia sp.]